MIALRYTTMINKGERQALQKIFDAYVSQRSVQGVLTLLQAGSRAARERLQYHGGYRGLVETMFPNTMDPSVPQQIIDFQNFDKSQSKYISKKWSQFRAKYPNHNVYRDMLVYYGYAYKKLLDRLINTEPDKQPEYVPTVVDKAVRTAIGQEGLKHMRKVPSFLMLGVSITYIKYNLDTHNGRIIAVVHFQDDVFPDNRTLSVPIDLFDTSERRFTSTGYISFQNWLKHGYIIPHTVKGSGVLVSKIDDSASLSKEDQMEYVLWFVKDFRSIVEYIENSGVVNIYSCIGCGNAATHVDPDELQFYCSDPKCDCDSI